MTLTPSVVYLTIPAFGYYNKPAEISTSGHLVLDLKQLKYGLSGPGHGKENSFLSIMDRPSDVSGQPSPLTVLCESNRQTITTMLSKLEPTQLMLEDDIAYVLKNEQSVAYPLVPDSRRRITGKRADPALPEYGRSEDPIVQARKPNNRKDQTKKEQHKIVA